MLQFHLDGLWIGDDERTASSATAAANWLMGYWTTRAALFENPEAPTAGRMVSGPGTASSLLPRPAKT